MTNALSIAQQLDAQDPLASYRERFLFPQHDGKDVAYFCGNSLGLQPKSVREKLLAELDSWATYGVEGHFMGKMPWKDYHHFFKESSAKLVGALPSEVVVMNTLTVNLHLMMVSFYRPTAQRYKIIMEAGAFPSDQYAMESQVRFHGFKYEDAVVEVAPREGEFTLRTEDILATIEEHKDSLALVMFAGVNYYTGQLFDMKAISEKAHSVGVPAGFDLAHAAGNVPMQLHDWGVDFAVWCSYKYLNSGPGGPSGLFVHERHGDNPDLPRFAGWWGHNEERRFLMERGFVPMKGADGWQLSNAQVLAMAAHKASLEIFDEVGMDKLREKSKKMSAFAFPLLKNIEPKFGFKVITPDDESQRGSQISILTGPEGKDIFNRLTASGIIADWREPNVIRISPVPLYCKFEDMWRFLEGFIAI